MPDIETRWFFRKAYDFLNEELFRGTLPSVKVTLNEHDPEVCASFWPRRDGSGSWELALNVAAMDDSRIHTLAILAHEMVHVHVEIYCEPDPDDHHDYQFEEKMLEIGLQPVAEYPDGIIKGGPFEKAYEKMVPLIPGWATEREKYLRDLYRY